MARLPCTDCLKGTCTTPFCEKWHPPECLFYKSENGCRLVKSALMRISRLMNSQAKGLQNGDKSAVAFLNSIRQLGCVSQDMEQPKSTTILRKSSNILKLIRCVRFTEAVLRHAELRDQNPSLGMICPGDPHQRNPMLPKFEDRSQEETEWQQFPREAAWKLAKNIVKLKEKHKTAFFSLSGKLVSTCTVSCWNQRKKKICCSTLVRRCTWSAKWIWITLNWKPWRHQEVRRRLYQAMVKWRQTHEEATVYVKELVYSWIWKSSRTRQQSYR